MMQAYERTMQTMCGYRQLPLECSANWMMCWSDARRIRQSQGKDGWQPEKTRSNGDGRCAVTSVVGEVGTMKCLLCFSSQQFVFTFVSPATA